MVILFKFLFFRCRSIQWVLSCATSIQCCYLSSYVWWSWEGKSCCNGCCSSRNIPKSKKVLFPFENIIFINWYVYLVISKIVVCIWVFVPVYIFNILLLLICVIFSEIGTLLVKFTFFIPWPPHFYFCFFWSSPLSHLTLWPS